MKNGKKTITIMLAAAVIMTAGCSTINRLHEYDLTGASMSLDVKAVGGPVVNSDYSYSAEQENPVLTVVKIGTNIVKADESRKTQQRMTQALADIYLPELVGELVYARALKALDADEAASYRDAEVILEVDVEEYGLNAWSYGGSVSMFIEMEARLFHKASGEVVWQRAVSVEEDVSPFFFGFDPIMGNVLNIASLGSLKDEELREGFRKLSMELMKETVSLLQEDLRASRRR